VWDSTNARLPGTRQLDDRNIRELLQAVGVHCLPATEVVNEDGQSLTVSLNSHFYRALFQRFAVDKQLPPIVRGEKMVIGGLPRTAYVSFPAYVSSCLLKLGLENEGACHSPGGRPR
jgi:hypothetical protein